MKILGLNIIGKLKNNGVTCLFINVVGIKAFCYKNKFSLSLCAAFFSFINYLAISSWSYTGIDLFISSLCIKLINFFLIDPEAWQHSFPTCGSNLQSPINIETASLKAYPKFYFGNYGNIDRMTVTNNGHTGKRIHE
jgi:hypothetical protein